MANKGFNDVFKIRWTGKPYEKPITYGRNTLRAPAFVSIVAYPTDGGEGPDIEGIKNAFFNTEALCYVITEVEWLDTETDYVGPIEYHL